jgi:hypothetical protein
VAVFIYSGIACKDCGRATVLAEDRDICKNIIEASRFNHPARNPTQDELVRITGLQASAASPYIVMMFLYI